MNKEIQELLYYYHEDGYEGYDLKEVQLLEKKDSARVEGLKQLLLHNNQYIAYQAMLILLAWGIPEGFEFLNRFMNEEWDKKENFEPHRLHGEDNVYDIIAEALSIASLNGKNEQELYPYIKRILDLYGEKFFESNVKEFLLTKDCMALFREMEQATQSALENKRYYQASQLFPVMVYYNKNIFSKYIDIFNPLIIQDSRIVYNIEEAEKMHKTC